MVYGAVSSAVLVLVNVNPMPTIIMISTLLAAMLGMDITLRFAIKYQHLSLAVILGTLWMALAMMGPPLAIIPLNFILILGIAAIAILIAIILIMIYLSNMVRATAH